MKKYLYLIIIAAMGFASCSDSGEESYMNFKLEYDGQPFIFFNDYSYPDGKVFNLTRFSFYVSELSYPGGSAIFSDNPVYVDLTNSHADMSSASAGYDLALGELDDMASINQLSFGIGVNATLNATTPENYSSDNDLSRSGEYWSGWNSYVFCKIEGNIDLDGDSVKETGMSLHLGSDPAFRELTLNGFENGNLNIVIDIKDIFQNGNDIFDIETTNRIHSLSQIDVTNELMDNLVAAIKVGN